MPETDAVLKTSTGRGEGRESPFVLHLMASSTPSMTAVRRTATPADVPLKKKGANLQFRATCVDTASEAEL